ncbi:hypothetical protein K432DRAFT_401256 [Lepidopterella palustris CBS 459.81]|uniref:Uncharacterized protein n=1 Tax=Lepidopterella palustris CBS 459.81 TaxID=1314670 RepID=A0A8E2JIV0_9PEZI|nr:hypothetical protein K432DRAFT_401256 [Lepidopterella palustris CBS 459.81]
MAPRVFRTTGNSADLGSELVKVALQYGDYTSWTKLPSTRHSTLRSRTLKRVEAVVIYAGYSLDGEFESLSEKQIRTYMEVNFFGLINFIRNMMELMQDLETGGVIQQVTSIGGQVGIKFSCIEPGGFRTDWSGRSMDISEKKNPAYDRINAKERQGKRHMTQAGDQPKAAEVFYELAVMENLPLRCIVETDAYSVINQKLELYKESVRKNVKLSNSTDVDRYKTSS